MNETAGASGSFIAPEYVALIDPIACNAFAMRCEGRNDLERTLMIDTYSEPFGTSSNIMRVGRIRPTKGLARRGARTARSQRRGERAVSVCDQEGGGEAGDDGPPGPQGSADVEVRVVDRPTEEKGMALALDARRAYLEALVRSWRLGMKGS